MSKYYHSTGIMDVVSIASAHDTTVVLPTLGHAIQWWRMYRTAITESHGGTYFVDHSKTAVVMRVTHTVLRLWVPYEHSVEMPMDANPKVSKFKRNCDYVSPYYTTRELRHLVGS